MIHFSPGMKSVKLLESEIPETVNWVLSGWTWRDQVRSIFPIGWAVSVARTVEAQVKNLTG